MNSNMYNDIIIEGNCFEAIVAAIASIIVLCVGLGCSSDQSSSFFM